MDLYTEIILDHFKNPRNKGEIKNATISITDTNPLCGDKIKIDLLLDSKKCIKKVAFTGNGCAISQAASSLLMDTLVGKSLNEIEKLKKEDIYKLLNVKISPGRSKCALLPLVALKKAAILAKHSHEKK